MTYEYELYIIIEERVKEKGCESVDFNKDLMIKNISFILSEKGKKIGELEEEAGVSVGYISRTAKDSKSKPGIDFVVKVADALNISIDTLLSIDLAELTPTEKYLISFLEKLKRDTQEDKLDWIRESAASLNRLDTDMDGYVEHPLFSLETFYEEGEAEYPEQVTRVVMTSKHFDCRTAIQGDCFNLRMKNGATLYVMNICKSVHWVNDPEAYAKEIWMCQYGKKQFLCDNSSGSPLSPLVEELYSALLVSSNHPKINRDLKDIIDSFMLDDLGQNDYDDEELPFN